MCGIIGYDGSREAHKILKTGLKRLEYRGYDSAGIASSNGKINIQKGVGTVDESVEEKLSGTKGVGHTRWATHGGVTDENAHPHTDCKEEIAVVHNGIIENFQELKKRLGGHNFKSETDTEVIPHLIEEELEKGKNLLEACENTKQKLKGSYAVVVLHESGMIAMKQDSPLVVAEKDGSVFVASDVTPLLNETEEFIFLENGDTADLREGVKIYNSDKEVHREKKKIDWDYKEASKKGYNHFMEKEIYEQSRTVKKAAFQDKKDLEEVLDLLEDARNIWTTGCGTAGIAASIGANYLREAGFDTRTELSHQLEYRKEEFTENDVVIAVSQSGETADLLSFLDKIDAKTVAVVNVVGSALDRQSEKSLYVNAGPEIGVASTKAFTGQITVMKLLKHLKEGNLSKGRNSLINTAENIENVIEENYETVENIAEYLSEKQNAFFIGRGPGFDLMREGSLKLKELSYIHSEAFPGGEFKHGTLALVEEGKPLFGLIRESERDEMMSNIIEAKSRGADIFAISSQKESSFQETLLIPNDENREILEAVPLQLLAYKTSLRKDNNPDRPRNLAKSVTVK